MIEIMHMIMIINKMINDVTTKKSTKEKPNFYKENIKNLNL